MDRPVEDYVLDLVTREQVAIRNLEKVRTGFEQFIFLLRVIGWRPGEISTMLQSHGRGYGRANIDRIIRNAAVNMEL